ncbi:MAG TPA: CHAT domain-containing protein, partial [Candidatus Angelobacter sp.]
KNDPERLMWARETNQVYRELAESKWRSHNVEEALEIWELYRGAAIRSAHEPQISRSGRGQVRPLLQVDKLLYDFSALARQTVISYLQVSDGLIVWVVDDRGIATQWIGISQQDMNRLATSFRDECADRNSNFASLRQHARALYDLLIAPIADHLSANRTLVIEPDDSAVEVPMAALIDSAGHYLGESYTIVLSPGLLYQRHLRDSKNLSVRERALVIGSPAQDRRMEVLEPLDSAVEEARYVADKFRASTLLIGTQATLDRVQRELAYATIFHFAGHGLAVHDKNGLLLAPSRDSELTGSLLPLLDASTLLSVKLDSLQLAVFSGCSTAGEGQNNLGDAGNLARLLLRSGVPHIVASQWNVDSVTTIDFMRAFYDQILTGSSVPDSLRTAASELRRWPSTSHPYYWAAFTTFGS